MNIVLTGMRGSGKSKIAQILSQKLDWALIDIDREIEKKENMTISEIVSKYGWDRFRKLESEAVAAAAKHKKETIISAGGGTIISPQNYRALSKHGKIIYLKRTPEKCYSYIKESINRPSLTGANDPLSDLKKTYEERKTRYEKTADLILNRTDNVEKDAKEIMVLMNQYFFS